MEIEEIRCLHCHRLFTPDKFNQHFQKYCTNEKCRHASKIASRRKCRNQPENKTPEKRKEESARVKKWQLDNPNYWKNKKNAKKDSGISVLRDIAQVQSPDVLRDIAFIKTAASGLSELIDSVRYYERVTIGLTSTLTGSVLRDIIGVHLDKYYDVGNRLLLSDNKSAITNIITERNRTNEKQSSN